MSSLAVILFLALVVAMVTPLPTEEQTRVKRFQQGEMSPSAGRNPGAATSGSKKNGGWDVGVERAPGGGTSVSASANRRIESRNGRIQGEVHGSWGRTYGGHNKGRGNKGFGGSVSGRW